MKNTQTTKKYILALQAFLLIAVFLIARPILTFAQDASGGNDGGSYDYTINPTDSGGYDYTSSAVDSGGYNYITNPVDSGGYDYTINPTDSGGYSSSVITSYPTTYSVGSTYYAPSVSYVNPSVGFYNRPATIVSQPTVVYQNPTYATTGFVNGTSYNTGTYNNGNYGSAPYLAGTCTASAPSASVGQMVTWSISVSGGNSNYQYFWTGDEGLSSTGQTIENTYAYSGTKNATVSVTSGDGQTMTRTCSITIAPAVVGNQVLAYSNTAQPLSSVYLSSVPYTGAGDIVRVISFILALLAWSVLLAYYFIKRKYGVNIFAPVLAKAETQNTDASVTGVFADKIISDAQAIAFVED